MYSANILRALDAKCCCTTFTVTLHLFVIKIKKKLTNKTAKKNIQIFLLKPVISINNIDHFN